MRVRRNFSRRGEAKWGAAVSRFVRMPMLPSLTVFGSIDTIYRFQSPES